MIVGKTPIVEDVYFKPTKEEGHHVKSLLQLMGLTFTELAKEINVSRSLVFNVIYGRCHSPRVESEIAHILGADSWNDIVIESRLVIAGILDPTKEQIEKVKQEISNRTSKSHQQVKEVV